jgi:biopolymer transport protein ExbD
VSRGEAQIEDEELESGEINLIPYLDIVTNLMLFILASVAANDIFGQINTTLPDQGAPPPSQVNQPDKPPDEQPLGLAVAVTRDEILVFSFSGLEGTLKEPKARIPLGPPRRGVRRDYSARPTSAQAAGLRVDPGRRRRCSVPRLNRVLDGSRRWVGREAPTFQAVLMADPSIPYGTLISVISTMRCKMGEKGKDAGECLMPTGDEVLKTAKDPVDPVNKLYAPDRLDYDPNHHALFSDVVFSTGFR